MNKSNADVVHISRLLTKSLSFEGNTDEISSYHQQYYYPRLVWKTAENQHRKERGACCRPCMERTAFEQADKHANMDGKSADSGHEQGFTESAAEAAAALVSSEGQQSKQLLCPRTDSLTVSEAGSTDTDFSEDYTRMTDVGIEEDLSSKLESLLSFNEQLTAANSADELSDDYNHGGIDRASSPQTTDGFKGIKIDGVKRSSLDEKEKPLLKLKVHPQALDLPNPPPSPDQTTAEDQSISFILGGENIAKDANQTEQDTTSSAAYEGGFFEDREFEFLAAQPIKRSTSLKTYKTPPGTPHRKKGVRFADALGLDLESVRHILNLEAPPKIPAAALKHLQIQQEGDDQKHLAAVGTRYLTACFSQPGASQDFAAKVSANKVMLENCLVDDTDMLITGTIRVANISYHKKVIVRYTVNNWVTHDDLLTNYVANSSDGITDRFSFTLTIPHYFAVGSKLQFCINYTTGGQTYWDSNHGNNYSIECYDKVNPFQDQHGDKAWLTFL